MYAIPNLGLGVIPSIIILISISVCITIYGKYNLLYSKNKDVVQIRKQEEQLSLTELILLYSNRILHCFFNIFICIIVISKPNLFLYIVCIFSYFLTFINLLFLQNECPLSYLEKKTLDKQYIFNSKKNEQPYRIIVFGIKDDSEKYSQNIWYKFIVFLILNSILAFRLYKQMKL